MREIKFRAWDEREKKMFPVDVLAISPCTWSCHDHGKRGVSLAYQPHIPVMQYTSLKDKNGKEICEGDVIRWHKPYRTTQTHTGNNIPNGSYTEPMEPGIKTYEGVVAYSNGMFIVEDMIEPLYYAIYAWTLEDIESAIAWHRPGAWIFDDPEEGDLQYLMEIAKVKTPEELIAFFNGVEIIGNIHENPEILK